MFYKLWKSLIHNLMKWKDEWQSEINYVALCLDIEQILVKKKILNKFNEKSEEKSISFVL